MNHPRSVISLLSVGALLATFEAGALEAQCPLEASELTNEAAYEIQRARELEEAAGSASYYRRALEKLEQSAAVNPNDVATLWLLGEVHIGLGDFAKADSALVRLVEVAPTCDERAEQTRRTGWVIAYNLGVQAFSAGDMTGALEAFEQASTIHQDARAYNSTAFIYEERGEIDKAIEAYRTAMELAEDPETGRAATINLAELMARSGRHQEAVEVYAAYTAEHPEDQLAVVNYAVILAQLGERERSRVLFEELLAREGQSFAELNQLGVGLLRVYAYDQAIPVFLKARELEPLNKEAMVNLVDAYIESEQFETAYAIADTLVDWYPYDAAGYTQLAQCLTHMDRAGESLVYLQLQQGLPFEFRGVHLAPRGDGYLLSGHVVGRGQGVGETVTVPFEFLGEDGAVVATDELEILVPPAQVSAPIRIQLGAGDPVAGYRYGRVQM